MSKKRPAKNRVHFGWAYLWHLMKQKKMEGVVAKDPLSFYYPGVRTPSWLKIKFTKTIDVIIIGCTRHTRVISSLAVGLYDHNKKLHYLGKVGTGYTAQSITQLDALFAPLTVKRMPALASHGTIAADIIWVTPKIVCEVRYHQFTQFGILRGSSFVRIRTELTSRDCTFEEQRIMPSL